MAYCNNCGAQLAEGTKFCSACGTAVGTPIAQQQPQPDTTNNCADSDKADVEANKVMAILSYLGILVLIPIFGAKESKFARFHANQGLILCLAAIGYSVAYSILSSIILAISWRLYFLVSILGFLSLVFLVLAVIGIINAANGQTKELPVIGKYRIIK